jgi:hypothetical protein
MAKVLQECQLLLARGPSSHARLGVAVLPLLAVRWVRELIEHLAGLRESAFKIRVDC